MNFLWRCCARAFAWPNPGGANSSSGRSTVVRSLNATEVVCVFAILGGHFRSAAVAQESVAPATDRQHLILIIGAPGTDEYKSMFSAWAARWEEAALKGGSECSVIGRAATESLPIVVSPVPAAEGANASPEDKPSTNGETGSGRTGPGDDASSLKQLEAAITVAGGVASTEPLWIVFIGHGTFDGRTASLNLQGPDVSAERMAELFTTLNRPVAFVGCASCTAPFVNALSAPGRVVVSATKDGNQIQFCRFGDAMSQAISGLDADINRDGQASLLEAWLFAARRTADFYKSEGRLATEHALLDDNGDAKGTRAEVFEKDRPMPVVENADKLDGKLAARWHFVRSDEERRLSIEQRQTRDALEARIEQLRIRRDRLEESDYFQQLEDLMLPLARLYESAESGDTGNETSDSVPVRD